MNSQIPDVKHCVPQCESAASGLARRGFRRVELTAVTLASIGVSCYQSWTVDSSLPNDARDTLNAECFGAISKRFSILGKKLRKLGERIKGFFTFRGKKSTRFDNVQEAAQAKKRRKRNRVTRNQVHPEMSSTPSHSEEGVTSNKTQTRIADETEVNHPVLPPRKTRVNRDRVQPKMFSTPNHSEEVQPQIFSTPNPSEEGVTSNKTQTRIADETEVDHPVLPPRKTRVNRDRVQPKMSSTPNHSEEGVTSNKTQTRIADETEVNHPVLPPRKTRVNRDRVQPKMFSTPNHSEEVQPKMSSTPNHSEEGVTSNKTQTRIADETEVDHPVLPPRKTRVNRDRVQPEVFSTPNPSEEVQPEIFSTPNHSEEVQPEIFSTPNHSEEVQPEIFSTPNHSEVQPEISSTPNHSEEVQPEISCTPNPSEGAGTYDKKEILKTLDELIGASAKKKGEEKETELSKLRAFVVNKKDCLQLQLANDPRSSKLTSMVMRSQLREAASVMTSLPVADGWSPFLIATCLAELVDGDETVRDAKNIQAVAAIVDCCRQLETDACGASTDRLCNELMKTVSSEDASLIDLVDQLTRAVNKKKKNEREC